MSTTNLPVKMRREDYKRVKHLNKEELTQYLSRIWMRGYTSGLEAAAKGAMPPEPQISDPDNEQT